MNIRDEIQKSVNLMDASTGRMEYRGSDYILRLAILELYSKIDMLTPSNRMPSQFEKALMDDKQ